MNDNFKDSKNGIVLAEMGGVTDGSFCAVNGSGAALVMLGTYIVDPSDSVPYPEHFVFKPGRASYASYLKEHIKAAHYSRAKVGVSVISIDVNDTVDFLSTAQEAGADYASLCMYSRIDMFIKAGLGTALCRKENFSHLKQWVKILLDSIDIPVVFKMGVQPGIDVTEAVKVTADCGAQIVHVDVKGCGQGCSELEIIKKLAKNSSFLIAGGGVKDIDGARRFIEAGANAVAIAKAAIKDENICGKIQSLLRSSL